MGAEVLASWRDTSTRSSIIGFVERVTAAGGTDFVPPEERVAVFDNDGTLWTEKPMPTQQGRLEDGLPRSVLMSA